MENVTVIEDLTPIVVMLGFLAIVISFGATLIVIGLTKIEKAMQRQSDTVVKGDGK